MKIDRFWKLAIQKSLEKVTEIPISKMDETHILMMKRIYEKLDGSWEGLSLGSVPSWELLRDVCYHTVKIYKKRGEKPFGE